MQLCIKKYAKVDGRNLKPWIKEAGLFKTTKRQGR